MLRNLASNIVLLFPRRRAEFNYSFNIILFVFEFNFALNLMSHCTVRQIVDVVFMVVEHDCLSIFEGDLSETFREDLNRQNAWTRVYFKIT